MEFDKPDHRTQDAERFVTNLRNVLENAHGLLQFLALEDEDVEKEAKAKLDLRKLLKHVTLPKVVDTPETLMQTFGVLFLIEREVALCVQDGYLKDTDWNGESGTYFFKTLSSDIKALVTNFNPLKLSDDIKLLAWSASVLDGEASDALKQKKTSQKENE